METQSPAGQPAKVYQRLGRKTLYLFISQQIGAGIIMLIAAILLSALEAHGLFSKTPLAPWSGWIVLAGWILFALTLGITLLATYLNYANYEFLLDDDALKIRRGILSRTETAIPYRQIQDVDIEQNFSERIWGIARLAILTAGHNESTGGNEDDSEGVLPAIDRTLADALQTELLRRADIEKVENEPGK